MLGYNVPIHPQLAATYLSLAVGGFILWCYWNQVFRLAYLPGRRFFVALITIAIVLLGYTIAKRGSYAGRSHSMEPGSRRDTDVSCPTGEQYRHSTRDRTRFDSDFPKVLGYPSTGGVLMLPLDIAVAEHLGIPRLEIAHRDLDSIEEDKFCDRLRLLGAKWWESEDTYMRKLIGFEKMTEMEKKEGIVVGWPEKERKGGVWILRKSDPNTIDMLKMCLSMNERCELLKRWGAVFYEDPRKVEEFEEFYLNEST